MPTACGKSSAVSIPLWYDWEVAESWYSGRISTFQFHFGTIERFRSMYKKTGKRCFNSTLVRLREWYGDKCTQNKRMFQFHFGTIERSCSLTIEIVLWLFQFHFGTIESCKEKIYYPIIFCFNSTLVRLRARSITLPVSIPPCFNSTLVRLRGRWQGKAHEVCRQFQFHFGTIESAVMGQWSWRCSVSIPLWYDWEQQLLSLCAAINSFNSTLVRLRADCRWKGSYRNKVSIPLWYDWEISRKRPWEWRTSV